jgi:hypothetical protein
MPDDEDTALDERRLMGEARDRTEAYVASSLGLTRVELSGDQIGRFSLVYDGTATSVAAADGQLLVGTETDVLIAAGEEFIPTEFGPAEAVSFAAGQPVAVSPDGDVSRLDGEEWQFLGSVVSPGRMDGDLLAAGDGVYRIGEGLIDLGGGKVRDVAAAGPYAATANGLARYDEGGWTVEVEGDCTLVAATDGRAHAVGEAGLFARGADGWDVDSLPADAPLADIGHGESFYAVTADGKMLVNAAPEVTPDGRGGWRSRSLGVPQVVDMAVL